LAETEVVLEIQTTWVTSKDGSRWKICHTGNFNFQHCFSIRSNSKGETGLATNEAIARYDRTSLLSWQYSFDWRVSNVFSYNGPKASGIAFSIFVISLHKFVIFLFSFLVFY
jgi:hypothetical protein